MALRLLVLGNSQDLIDGGDGRSTAMWRVAAGLEEYLQERVDLHHVIAYPNLGLSRYAERVLDRVDPDVVLVHCMSATIGPQTLDTHILHLFGPRQYAQYRRLRAAIRRLSGLERSQATALAPGLLAVLYQGLRDGLLRLGFGATLMSVEEATASYAALFRLLAGREELIICVRGPAPKASHARIPRLQAGLEARTAAFDAALAAACQKWRIVFCSGQPLGAVLQRHLQPDGMHYTPEGHALLAEAELSLLRGSLTEHAGRSTRTR